MTERSALTLILHREVTNKVEAIIMCARKALDLQVLQVSGIVMKEPKQFFQNMFFQLAL